MLERGFRARPGFCGTRVGATGSARTGPPVAVGSDVAVPVAIGSALAGAPANARPRTTRASTTAGAGRGRKSMRAILSHDVGPRPQRRPYDSPMRGADGLRATRLVTMAVAVAAVLAAVWPAGAPAAA